MRHPCMKIPLKQENLIKRFKVLSKIDSEILSIEQIW